MGERGRRAPAGGSLPSGEESHVTPPRAELRACWEPRARAWESPRNPCPIPEVQGWASFPVTLTDPIGPLRGQGGRVIPFTGVLLHLFLTTYQRTQQKPVPVIPTETSWPSLGQEHRLGASRWSVEGTPPQAWSVAHP